MRPERTTTSRGIIVFVLAALAVPVMCYGIGGLVARYCFDGHRCQRSTVSRAEVQSIAELTLPDDARLEVAVYQQWLEWELYAKVSFPRAELPDFLSSNGLPTPDPTRRVVPDGTGLDIDGWHPETARNFGGLSACMPSACRELMIDSDVPGVAVVHIHLLSDDQPLRSTQPER